MTHEIRKPDAIDAYIKRLQDDNRSLLEGRCRFNCKTNKEAYLAGYEAAQQTYTPEPKDALERYAAWKDE